MRKAFGLIVVLWCVALSSNAYALSFSDVQDFTGESACAIENGKLVQKTGKWIKDTGNVGWLDPGDNHYKVAYSYTHNVSFDPAAASVDEAWLDITFTANLAMDVLEKWEVWFVDGDTYTQIGDFSQTQSGACNNWWATDHFDLTAFANGVQGDSWSVVIAIDESTIGVSEEIFIAESKLWGTYTPVPEPTTLSLLGFGLLGFVGFVGRKRR